MVAVVLVGTVLGACTMLVVDDTDAGAPFVAEATPGTASPVVNSPPVLLVWTPDGLAPGLAAGVDALPATTRVTEVRGDLVEMVDPAAPAGYVTPLDALSIDPAGYASFLPKGAGATLATLGPGEAVIGETSARLRRIGVGGSIDLSDGAQMHIVGVLDDALVGAAELVVAHDTLPAIVTPRFLLVAYDGPREAIEREIRELLPSGTAVRFRAPGETPLMRHGDAVLPQATVKEQFGEFSYRHVVGGDGRELELDPAWVRDHIVEAEMPILGTVRCHRAIVDELRAALVDLEQRNLAYLVAADGYRGCFVARLVAVDGGVSRHAWGVALDVNWPKNREGELGTQDPRLIDTMTEHGFTWGGPWLVPDPAHFEWVAI